MTSKAAGLSAIAIAVLAGLLYGTFRPRSSDTLDDVTSSASTTDSRVQETVGRGERSDDPSEQSVGTSAPLSNEAGAEAAGKKSPITPEDIIALHIRSYKAIKENLTEEHRQVLFAMLKDVRYAKYWRVLARYIGLMGRSDASTEALIAYISESEGWRHLEKRKVRGFFIGRADDIHLLGFTGGPAAESFLADMISGDGALDLVLSWKSDGMINPWGATADDFFAGFLHARAAKGIYILGDPELIRVLEGQIEESIEIQDRIGDIYPDDPDNAAKLKEYGYHQIRSSGIADAEFERLLLDRIGEDQFKELYYDSELKRQLFRSEVIASFDTEEPQ